MNLSRGTVFTLGKVWDINTLTYVPMQQPLISTDTLTVTLSGVSTSAKQDTGNASLASIDGKITAVNTGAVAFASPQHVIVDSAPTTAVTGTFYQATQPVSGAISFTAPQHTIVDSGSLNVDTLPAITGTVSVSNMIAAVETGLAKDASLTTGNASLASIKTNSDTLVTNTTSIATSARQDTSNTYLATIATDVSTAQGADGTSIAGPMIQGLVNDTPNSYNTGYVQPLSLTAEGRLRVSSSPSTFDQIWQDTLAVDPWDEIGSLWGACPSIAESTLSNIGE